MADKLAITTDPAVGEVFRRYPGPPRAKLEALRALIIDAARGAEDVTRLEETLKWGEPSYIANQGSTIRMDWKERSPRQYALYFNCNSKLVATFRLLYQDLFQYEGNRAVVFGMDDPLPTDDLRKCLLAALRYHKVKNLPNLGL